MDLSSRTRMKCPSRRKNRYQRRASLPYKRFADCDAVRNEEDRVRDLSSCKVGTPGDTHTMSVLLCSMYARA